jgi:hypothetical protein
MQPLRHLQPALAALLAACVLLLGLAVNSPALHAHLHVATACADGTDADHDHNSAPATADADHGCAVTLFATGCETPVAFAFCPPLALHAEGVTSFTELLLARTLRGPEQVCGPPVFA